MSDQKTEQKPEHEKRIREALESHDLFGISLEDWGKACTPTAIRALLADLDAVRADAQRYRLLRRGQHWSVVDGVGDILRAEELDARIDAALKGATA